MDNVRPDIIMEKVYGLIPGLTLMAGLQTDIFSRLDGRQPGTASSTAQCPDCMWTAGEIKG